MNSSKKSRKLSKDKNDIILVNSPASSSKSLNGGKHKSGKSKNYNGSTSQSLSSKSSPQIPASPNCVQLSSSSKSSKKSTSSSKMVQILLGFPDGHLTLEEDVDPYLTKIGGIPNWLVASCPISYDFIICENCGKEMFLLFQGYMPFEDSAYDRVLYVWGCNQHRCMRRSGSFRAMRAHRLNEKYALKQQKKNNPESFKIDSFLEASSSSINLGDALFSSINTNTAIGGLGGMLFGDEDNGLIEETTSPLLLSESSQGPSIRTWIQVVESNLKDEGSIESKLCDETVSKLVLDDSPEKRLKATWPKKFSFFPAQYVYIMEEILEEERTLIDLKKYGHYLNIPAEGEYVVGEENDGESFDWAGEKYEKSCLPKGVDKAFRKFSDRVNEWPDQCIRYEFDGQPLLYNQSDATAALLLSSPYGSVKQLKTTTHLLPKCPKCGSRRTFEFQLMPNILCVLPTGEYSGDVRKSVLANDGVSQFDFGMEWGTIMVFTCSKDCNLDEVGEDSVSYYEELVLVQYEE